MTDPTENPYETNAEARHDWYFSAIKGETACRRCGKARKLGQLFERCRGWPVAADDGPTIETAFKLMSPIMNDAARELDELRAENTRLRAELAAAQADKGEAVAVEREACAKVARDRQAICRDAVEKIEAGELYPNLPRKETAATERCAAMEAGHIADLIEARALPASVKEG